MLKVPLAVVVLPLSAAVRPAGRPVTVRLLYGARPLLTGMVPLKPAWFTVQAVGDRAPRLGPETLLLMVMVKVPLPAAPVASWTVSWTLGNAPAVVGVPLTVMVLPLSAAVRPGGRLLAVRLLYEPVPPMTATVPLKPGWLTVHAEDDSAPSVGAGLMVMLNVPVPVAPIASWTVM